MTKYLVFFILGFSLIACQKKQVVHVMSKDDKSLIREVEYVKKVKLNLQALKINAIQEKLTLRDELVLNASISVFENGKIVHTGNNTSFLKGVKKGDVIPLDSIQLPEFEVKKNQLLGVQVSIWEVDDYTQINQRFRQINQIGGLVQIPITLLEWSSVSNPVGWFLWGARIGGLGMSWLSQKDKDDLMGVSEVQWLEKDMPSVNFTRSKKEVFTGKGNALTNFNYVLTYQIISKEIIR